MTRPRAPARVHGSERLGGERTIETVVLENAYLRVEVAPELGGALVRAVDTATGENLFYREPQVKNWLPFRESGVKVSLPFREHGIRTEGQPASWRIVRRQDGSVTLAMWMEFARPHRHHERWMCGRYSPMLLSWHVTLRPDEALPAD